MQFSLFSVLALAAVSSSNAWTSSLPLQKSAIAVSARGHQSSTSSTRLYNVPPPSLNDVEAFKAYADKQPPPASFFELQQDCVQATQLALRDGHKYLEVEFPPLPANVLEMDDVSAYEISNANLNLALDYAKGIMAATSKDSSDNSNEKSYKKFAILFPDEAETDIAVEKMLGGSKNPYPGIQVAALRQSEEGDDRMFKVRILQYVVF